MSSCPISSPAPASPRLGDNEELSLEQKSQKELDLRGRMHDDWWGQGGGCSEEPHCMTHVCHLGGSDQVLQTMAQDPYEMSENDKVSLIERVARQVEKAQPLLSCPISPQTEGGHKHNEVSI